MRTLKRRRRESKTDYKARLGLLKSGIARVVIRRTNRYFIVQAIESHEAQDKILAGVSSKDLLKNGWDVKYIGSLKSLPAAYLTGMLMAKKLKGEAILDFGMARMRRGGRLGGVAKGLVDGGAKVRVSEKIFPSDERVKGEHLKDEVKSMINKVMEKLK